MLLESVLAHWFSDYGSAHVVPLGEGHIHATYRVEVSEGVFVLQNINEYVFKDGDLVMLQTARLLECWREQSMYVVPELKVTLEGMPSVRVDGALWRVWSYVSGARVVDPVENITQAQAAGVAFGALQHSLAQLHGARFQTPIEGFLQLQYYLERFSEVAGKAPKDLLDIVEAHSYLADQLSGMNSHIHGDCKVNNLLFQEASDRVIAVIDFDTAMYGHWAWDFGDLVRSVSHSRGCCEVQYFAACLRGFATHQPLCTVGEAVVAPGYVALMLGVRFLTDHLSGDVYFRVSEHGENLHRAQQQFVLFAEFMRFNSEFCEVAEQILG